MDRRNPLVMLLTLALLVLTSPAVVVHHQSTHLTHALDHAMVQSGSSADAHDSAPAWPDQDEQDCPTCHLLTHTQATTPQEPAGVCLRLTALPGLLRWRSVHVPESLHLSDLGGRDPPIILPQI